MTLSENTNEMKYSLEKSLEILARTPLVLEQWLRGLSDEWIMQNEGPDTFSPYDVVGHLIHGEKADWIARMDIILSEGPEKTFRPYDRFAQYEESRGKTMDNLLDEFKILRARNIEVLRSRNISAQDFEKTGIHPTFGEVQLRNLLATWTAHDLSHIAQIARVMAKQYKEEVGKWIAYLPVMTK